MKQLNFFSDNECAYCGNGEADHKNELLWNGFLDQDTGDLVCNECKVIHYLCKARKMGTLAEDGVTILSMTYSEMPVYNFNLERRINESV